MHQMEQYTDFDAALKIADDELAKANRKSSKIILFQTDGEGDTRLAQQLRNKGITISTDLGDIL